MMLDQQRQAKEQAEQMKREREEMMKYYREREEMKEAQRITEMENLKEEMRKISMNNNNNKNEINNNNKNEEKNKIPLENVDRALLLSHVKNVLSNTPLSIIKTEKKFAHRLQQPSPSSTPLKHEFSSARVDFETEEEKYFVDDQETYIKNRDAKLDAKEKIIYEDEDENESHLQSYVKWLERRQKLHPYNALSPLYRKRHSLLSPLGRRLEWIRTGFKLGFPINLYGNQNNRWYLYFMQKHDKTHTLTRNVIRKVDVRSVQISAMSYDNHDTKVHVVDDEMEDLLPNSRTLGGLPSPLRFSPDKHQTAKSSDLSLSEYGKNYIKLKNLRANLLRPNDSDSSSSSSDSSSSDSDDEDTKCESCGITIKLRPYAKYCITCEGQMKKKKNKTK